MKNPFRGMRFSLLDLQNMRGNLGIRIAIIAIATIPLLYGALYLYAFLDPYKTLSDVPVAVVNLDEGAVQDNGELITAGDDLCEELDDSDDKFGWRYVSAEQAQTGLENKEYYLTITIPKDFSSDIASAEKDAPQVAELSVVYDWSQNMLASQIASASMSRIQEELNAKIEKTYYDNIFDKLSDSADDIQEAADGSEELYDGLDELNDGAIDLADAIDEAADGSSDLNDGMKKLADGSEELDSKTPTLVDGLDQLDQGTMSLKDGASQLNDGVQTLADAVPDLADGADDLADGVETLVDTLQTAMESIDTLTDAQDDVTTTSTALYTSLQDLASDSADAASALGSYDDDALAVGLQNYVAAEAGELDSDAISKLLLNGPVEGPTTFEDVKTNAEGIAISTKMGNADGAANFAMANAGADPIVSGRTGKLGCAEDAVANMLLAGSAKKMALVDTGTNTDIDYASKAAADTEAVASILSEQSAIGYIEAYEDAISDDSSDLHPEYLIAAKVITNTVSDGLTSNTEVSDNAAAQYAALENLSDVSSSALSAFSDPDTADNLEKLEDGASDLADGADELNSAIQGDGTADSPGLVSSMADLYDGSTVLSDNMMVALDASKTLQEGITTLDNGIHTAYDGTTELADGMDEMNDKMPEFTDGTAEALDGAGELRDGLVDGAADAKEQTKNSAAKAEMMSEPVSISESDYTSVANYGTGFAPYFCALGLWVGAIMLSFLAKPLNGRLISSGANPFIVAFSGAIPNLIIGTVQVAALGLVLQYALKLTIDHVLWFYLFLMVTMIVYNLIMQLLIGAFGFSGKFAAIIVLMLQLTSSAGTFPIETTPMFFRIVSPYMPMTYVVSGMREVMTGINLAAAGHDLMIVALFGLGSFLLTVFLAHRKRTVRLDDLHPLVDL